MVGVVVVVGDGFGWGPVWCSLLTMWMLELSMEAIEVEVVARATAVQNWSESAVRRVVWLLPVKVRVVFCECLLQDIAML